MAETSKLRHFPLAARRSLYICPSLPASPLSLLLLLRLRFVLRLTFSRVARCSFSTTKRVSGHFFKRVYQLRAYEWTVPRPQRRLSHILGAPAMTCFSATCTSLPEATLWMAARLPSVSSKLPEHKNRCWCT